MSEFKRLERLVRSLIPRFPRDPKRQYALADARHMINELGLQMPPEVLSFLVSDDAILDDFIHSIYDLEARLGRKVIDAHGAIDAALDPQVYVEGGEVGFSITHRGKEMVFAEYRFAEED
jgi:hypothetical protein